MLCSKVLRGGTKGWKPTGPLHANALWGHVEYKFKSLSETASL